MNILHKKEFFRFLKENDAYTRFISNVYNKKISLVISKYDYDSIDLNFFDDNVINSFIWHKTNEGREFWNKLYYEWQDILNNYEQFQKKKSIYPISKRK